MCYLNIEDSISWNGNNLEQIVKFLDCKTLVYSKDLSNNIATAYKNGKEIFYIDLNEYIIHFNNENRLYPDQENLLVKINGAIYNCHYITEI